MKILLDLLFPVVFNGLVLGLSKLALTPSMWFSLAIINISYAVYILGMRLRNNNNAMLLHTERTALFCHFFAQLIFGLLCLLFKIAMRPNVVIVVLIFFVGAGAYLTLRTHNQRDLTESRGVNAVKLQLNSLTFRVEACMRATDDAETKKLLEKLADSIRYAQVSSNPAAAEQERQVDEIIRQLDDVCGNKDYEKAARLVNQALECMRLREHLVSQGQ